MNFETFDESGEIPENAFKGIGWQVNAQSETEWGRKPYKKRKVVEV
jgi:hypothetical protein